MPSPSDTPAPPLSADDYEAERLRIEQERFQKNGAGHVSDQDAPINFPQRTVAPVGRTLPHSIEAEEYLLSCCLLDGKEIVNRCITANIRPESFYVEAHGIIFERLLELYNAKKEIDISIVAEELKTARQLDAVGGYAFLTQVSSRIPTTAQAGYFIDKVREQSKLREIIRSCTGAVEECYNFTGDIDQFQRELEFRIGPVISDRASTAKTYTVWSPAKFREWQPSLEANLLGAGYLRRRQITTLIGPPGVGKSRLSLWLAVSHICGRTWANLDPKGGECRWFMVGNENDPERQKRDLDFFYRNLTAAEQAKVDARLAMHVIDTYDDAQLAMIDPAVYLRMVATLKTVKPDVIVFDPWGNMIEGSESDDAVIRDTLKRLLRAVGEGAPDAAVLIIHHARTGKTNTIEAGNNYSGGSLGRGSKVLVSQARCELALWPGDSEDSTKLVLTCEKVNNAPKFEPVGFVFENGIYSVDGTFSVKAWRDDIEGKRSRRVFTVADVVAIVRQGARKPKDIVNLAAETPFGATRSTVYERLREACDKGYILSAKGEYMLPTGKISQTDLAGMRDDEPPPVNPHDPEDRLPP